MKPTPFRLSKAIATRRALTCSARRHVTLSFSERMELARVRKAISAAFTAQ